MFSKTFVVGASRSLVEEARPVRVALPRPHKTFVVEYLSQSKIRRCLVLGFVNLHPNASSYNGGNLRNGLAQLSAKLNQLDL
ncbi:MAG: hypothetical protein AAF757_32885 [Cyanobacteria bacterium P01_D01_bin.116]